MTTLQILNGTFPGETEEFLRNLEQTVQHKRNTGISTLDNETSTPYYTAPSSPLSLRKRIDIDRERVKGLKEGDRVSGGPFAWETEEFARYLEEIQRKRDSPPSRSPLVKRKHKPLSSACNGMRWPTVITDSKKTQTLPIHVPNEMSRPQRFTKTTISNSKGEDVVEVKRGKPGVMSKLGKAFGRVKIGTKKKNGETREAANQRSFDKRKEGMMQKQRADFL